MLLFLQSKYQTGAWQGGKARNELLRQGKVAQKEKNFELGCEFEKMTVLGRGLYHGANNERETTSSFGCKK